MIDFSWTPQQIEWKTRVIGAAQTALGQNLRERDRQQLFNWNGYTCILPLPKQSWWRCPAQKC